MLTLFLVFSIALLTSTFAFNPISRPLLRKTIMASKITITDGVEFDTIAREWRFKWSPDNDKKSLAVAQQTLVLFQSALANIDGVKSVQRIVCGGCFDYKVIIALPAEKFGPWEQKGFAPESDFIAAINAVPGITSLETQTYTLTQIL